MTRSKMVDILSDSQTSYDHLVRRNAAATARTTHRTLNTEWVFYDCDAVSVSVTEDLLNSDDLFKQILQAMPMSIVTSRMRFVDAMTLLTDIASVTNESDGIDYNLLLDCYDQPGTDLRKTNDKIMRAVHQGLAERLSSSVQSTLLRDSPVNSGTHAVLLSAITYQESVYSLTWQAGVSLLFTVGMSSEPVDFMQLVYVKPLSDGRVFILREFNMLWRDMSTRTMFELGYTVAWSHAVVTANAHANCAEVTAMSQDILLTVSGLLYTQAIWDAKHLVNVHGTSVSVSDAIEQLKLANKGYLQGFVDVLVYCMRAASKENGSGYVLAMATRVHRELVTAVRSIADVASQAHMHTATVALVDAVIGEALVAFIAATETRGSIGKV